MNVNPTGTAMQMFKNDLFSQWLGIRIINVGPGSSTLEMHVRPDMCNGFGIVHGGIAVTTSAGQLIASFNGTVDRKTANQV